MIFLISLYYLILLFFLIIVFLGGVVFCSCFCFCFVLFLLFRASLAAYGGSQARGLIRATAASLHHSSQQCQILNPLSEAGDQTHNLMVPSHICLHPAAAGTPLPAYFYYLFLLPGITR